MYYLRDLKRIAEEFDLEVWFPVLSYRHITEVNEKRSLSRYIANPSSQSAYNSQPSKIGDVLELIASFIAMT